MKLTKVDAALHQQACDLIALDRPLTADEQEFVLPIDRTTGRHAEVVGVLAAG